MASTVGFVGAGIGVSSGAVRAVRARRHGVCGRVRMESDGGDMAGKGYAVNKVEELMDLGDKKMAKYRFQFELEPSLSKKVMAETTKGFAQRSYPGFRKGSIPPFLKPQLKEYVLHESMALALENALESENLERLDVEGEARDVTYPEEEDMKTMKKRFTPGEPFSYVAEVSLQTKEALDAEATAEVLDTQATETVEGKE